jgi:hypothetical protein
MPAVAALGQRARAASLFLVWQVVTVGVPLQSLASVQSFEHTPHTQLKAPQAESLVQFLSQFVCVSPPCDGWSQPTAIHTDNSNTPSPIPSAFIS